MDFRDAFQAAKNSKSRKRQGMQSSFALFSGKFVPFVLIVALNPKFPQVAQPLAPKILFFCPPPLHSPNNDDLGSIPPLSLLDFALSLTPGWLLSQNGRSTSPPWPREVATFDPPQSIFPHWVDIVMGGQQEGLQPRGLGSMAGRRLSPPRLPRESGGGPSSLLMAA